MKVHLIKMKYSAVAQLVERLPVKELVVGSIPTRGAATGFFGPLTRADANSILSTHPDWVTTLSNSNTYSNVNGNTIKSPSYSSHGVPAGATAQCGDGTYSFSLHHSGTCSHHGGVSQWLN